MTAAQAETSMDDTKEVDARIALLREAKLKKLKSWQGKPSTIGPQVDVLDREELDQIVPKEPKKKICPACGRRLNTFNNKCVHCSQRSRTDESVPATEDGSRGREDGPGVDPLVRLVDAFPSVAPRSAIVVPPPPPTVSTVGKAVDVKETSSHPPTPPTREAIPVVDPEVRAIAALVAALDGLDAAATGRVLAYVTARFAKESRS
jgi:hypothetical protein